MSLLAAVLLHSVQSYAISQQITNQIKYRIFPDFGFTAHGRVLMRFLGMNMTGVKGYMIPAESNIKHIAKQLCSDSLHVSNIMHYNAEKGHTWEQVVNQSGIMVPVITNCYKKAFTVTIHLRNADNYLDSREKPLPAMYSVLSYVYIVISIAIFVDQFLNPHMCVFVHHLVACASVAKIFDCTVAANMWRLRSETGSRALLGEMGRDAIQVVCLSLLYSTNLIVMMGFGSYRSTHLFETLLSMGATFCLYLTIVALSKETTLVWLLLVLNVLKLFGLFVIFGSIWRIVRRLFAIHDLMIGSREIIMQKIRFVMKFSGNVLAWLCVFVCTQIYFVMNPSSLFVCELSEELLNLSLLCIDMAHLLYMAVPDEQESELTEEIEVTEEQEIDPAENMTALMEPVGQSFVYLV